MAKTKPCHSTLFIHERTIISEVLVFWRAVVHTRKKVWGSRKRYEHIKLGKASEVKSFEYGPEL